MLTLQASRVRASRTGAHTTYLKLSGVAISSLMNAGAIFLTAAYYGFHQNAYGTGALAGCTTSANSACSGSLEAFSVDADYFFNQHFDAYLGAMYSGVHDGAASGYAFNTTNINPTVGVRYKF